MATFLNKLNAIDETQLPHTQTNVITDITTYDYNSGESYRFNISWTPHMTYTESIKNDGYYMQILQQTVKVPSSESPQLFDWVWSSPIVEEYNVEAIGGTFDLQGYNNHINRYRLGLKFVSNQGTAYDKYYFAKPFTINGRHDTLSGITDITATTWTYIEDDPSGCNAGCFYPTISCTNPNKKFKVSDYGDSGSYVTSFVIVKAYINDVLIQEFTANNESDIVLTLAKKTFDYTTYPVPTEFTARFQVENDWGDINTGTTYTIYLTSGTTVPNLGTPVITIDNITTNSATVHITGNTTGGLGAVINNNGADPEHSQDGDYNTLYYNDSNPMPATLSIKDDFYYELTPDTAYNICIVMYKGGVRLASNVVNFTTLAS